MANFNNFFNSLNFNPVLNNIPTNVRDNIRDISRNTLHNINPVQIQSAANALWNRAELIINNNIPFAQNFMTFKESVTLLVDISAEDRLFLQHEARKELDTIINESKCKVDINQNSNFGGVDPIEMAEGSRLSINGPPNGVCDAYLTIRQLLPITVWFDLKLNTSLQSIIFDPNAAPLQDMQKKYDIAICVVPMQSCVIQPTPSDHISIYIRTNRRNEAKLKNGIEELTNFIESNNYGNIYPKIQTKIDVPSNQPSIVGRSYSMLDPIATKTHTQISVQKSATNLMSNLSITGANYSAISFARSEISDRFVIELTFTVTEPQSRVLENFGRQLERMSEEFSVHILMKPNTVPTNKTMIIKGADKEVVKLFEVRKHVIALMVNPIPTTVTNGGPIFGDIRVD